MTSHEEFLAVLAREHFLEGRSKVEIARRHEISRFLVARLLDEARDRGVVRIEIRTPSSSGIDEEALAARLGAHRITIVSGSQPAGATSSPSPLREELARAVAEELSAAARAGMTIGISWSRTLDLASRHVRSLPSSELIQLAGALPLGGTQTSVELIHRLGELAGGRTRPMWAPLVVEDAATASGLYRQPEIADALSRADAMDLAVVAFGAWEAGRSTIYDRVGNDIRHEARLAGAIAECSGRLFDSAGQPVAVLDDRVVAVTLAQLIRTPEVIGVASGAAVAPGIIAAVSAGIVGTLVIDAELAAELSRLVGLDGRAAGASEPDVALPGAGAGEGDGAAGPGVPGPGVNAGRQPASASEGSIE